MARRCELCTSQRNGAQPSERAEELWRLAKFFTQISGMTVCLLYFGSGISLGHGQRNTQSQRQSNFLPRVLARVPRRRDRISTLRIMFLHQTETMRQMANSFLVRTSLQGIVCGALKIVDRSRKDMSMFKVDGQFCGNLCDPLSIAALFSLSDCTMELKTATRWNTVIQDILVQ